MKVKVTNSSGLYVRTGPGSHNEHKDILEKGDQVDIIETVDKDGQTWGKIDDESWINTDFVTTVFEKIPAEKKEAAESTETVENEQTEPEGSKEEKTQPDGKEEGEKQKSKKGGKK